MTKRVFSPCVESTNAGMCILPFGHSEPHVWTPLDKIKFEFFREDPLGNREKKPHITIEPQAKTPGYLGYEGPTQCIDCGIKRPTVAQVESWGFMCGRCARIFCTDCGRKDGIVKRNNYANCGMNCRHCLKQISQRAAV